MTHETLSDKSIRFLDAIARGAVVKEAAFEVGWTYATGKTMSFKIRSALHARTMCQAIAIHVESKCLRRLAESTRCT